MSYGARVWNAAGQLIMDTNTFTYQILWSGMLDFTAATAASPVTLKLSIPEFKVSNCIFMILPVDQSQIISPDSSTSTIAHPYVTTADGVVTARSQHPNGTANQGFCKISVRGYAIRYKA